MPTATQQKRDTRGRHNDGPSWSSQSLCDPRFSQSLERGLAILRSYSPSRPVLGIADLADGLGMSRSTTHRYVITLVELGYLEQTPNRKYRLGLQVIDLGLSALNSTGLREHAEPYLKELCRRASLTTCLTVLQGTEILVVDRAEAYRRGTPVGKLQPGSRLPAFCTAAGKLLLASLPVGERKELLGKVELVKQGPNSISSKKALLAELEAIGESGVAVNDEEWRTGEVAIAVGVRNAAQEVVAAVSLTASKDRMSAGQLEDGLFPHLATAADDISKRLGYRR